MSDYKLTSTDVVIRTADNAYIPNDAANADWQAYQQWLADGGAPQPKYPTTTLSTPSQTITLPTGGTVTLASQSLPVPYTWDGEAWVADLAALRLARLALIREHRKTLYDSCNLATIRGNNTNNRGLKRQAGEWNTKLDNVPTLATTALDALTTAADIAAYTPDYDPPAYVYVVSAVQFFTVLQDSGYLTAEQCANRAILPTALATAFDSLTPPNDGLARGTWANFTEVAEDEALVPLVSAALGVALEDVHSFFVAAFAVV
ncbi:hypothetical protein UFOVP354_36 [uncultured Caudovirales phage]|uniref:Uncharacterized protein n=1 Tax=uncultured Caudovirales phage TaxID=2100421 RepID=A0A6J5M2M0_9CAUD|nr:hypothetical protein UFOVP354_36 [uncultured Caudovirales phage]